MSLTLALGFLMQQTSLWSQGSSLLQKNGLIPFQYV